MSEDVFAAMGISGFGKKPRQRQLDPNRFEKNKREEVRRCNGLYGTRSLMYYCDSRDLQYPKRRRKKNLLLQLFLPLLLPHRLRQLRQKSRSLTQMRWDHPHRPPANAC